MARAWALVAAILVLSLVLAAGGCGGGAEPSEADLTGANVVLIDDATGELRAHETAIRAGTEKAIARAAALMPLAGVQVTVLPDARRAITGWGVGGRTLGPSTVQIYLDPGRTDLALVIEQRLPPLVAHELHHAMRWRGPGYGATLFEAMVSEGLADHFAMQALGAALPPWSNAFGPERDAELMGLARPEFDSRAYNHERWFFDAGQPELPRWTGYTLGYRLVQAYLAANPGASAATLVVSPAQAFRPR